MRFPAPTHSLYAVLDRSHIEQAFREPHRLPTLREAISDAKRTIAESNGMFRSIDCLVFMADDSIELHRIGPRGGHKRLWQFGKVS